MDDKQCMKTAPEPIADAQLDQVAAGGPAGRTDLEYKMEDVIITNLRPRPTRGPGNVTGMDNWEKHNV